MWNPWRIYGQLSARGIMGINRRNSHYIGNYNPRYLFPKVDDKLQTKLLAETHQVQSPRLIGVIDSQHQVKNWSEMVSGESGFVIKPAKGSGGKGIILLRQPERGLFTKLNGQSVSPDFIRLHISNILSGLYSLGGKPDVAVVESLIEADPIFSPFVYEGVPDIRVIVFLGFPTMAMIRLPTASSDGKANLHQGAVGVGLNIATGRAESAVQLDRPIEFHPDTKNRLTDLQVPGWEKLLEMASRCYDMTKLGYLGVDVVLDKNSGPMLLELNARPGLAIQTANNRGLLPRLQHIENLRETEKKWDIATKLNHCKSVVSSL